MSTTSETRPRPTPAERLVPIASHHREAQPGLAEGYRKPRPRGRSTQSSQCSESHCSTRSKLYRHKSSWQDRKRTTATLFDGRFGDLTVVAAGYSRKSACAAYAAGVDGEAERVEVKAGRSTASKFRARRELEARVAAGWHIVSETERVWFGIVRTVWVLERPQQRGDAG